MFNSSLIQLVSLNTLTNVRMFRGNLPGMTGQSPPQYRGVNKVQMFDSSKCMLPFHHDKILAFLSAFFDKEFQPEL